MQWTDTISRDAWQIRIEIQMRLSCTRDMFTDDDGLMSYRARSELPATRKEISQTLHVRAVATGKLEGKSKQMGTPISAQTINNRMPPEQCAFKHDSTVHWRPRWGHH
jgi:hypothetical protein